MTPDAVARAVNRLLALGIALASSAGLLPRADRPRRAARRLGMRLGRG